jgi:hypothetical protein
LSTTLDARVVYLIAFPHSVKALGLASKQPPLTKSAPYFLEIDTAFAELGQSAVEIGGLPVTLRRQLIDEQVQSVECSYALRDALNAESARLKQAVNAQLRETVLREAGYSGAFVEEYVIVCLAAEAGPAPDTFVEANRLALTALLRRHTPSKTETEQTLISRARYSDLDLTIVDWEGAVIIDSDEDFQSDIELMKIGNYQLLRYRLLDRAIERNLEKVSRELESKRTLSFSSGVLRQALQQRLALLLNFEKIEQRLLLIGDWYTAELYRLIVDEFYIDEWKAAVRGKLDQLDRITEAVRENFTFSWRQFLDFVEISGWLLLLIGYFVLFILEAGWAK